VGAGMKSHFRAGAKVGSVAIMVLLVIGALGPANWTPSPIRATSAVNGTDRPKIAAASPASMGCSKPSPIPSTRIMPMRSNGLPTTIPTPSTNCRSNLLSAVLPTGVTLLAHASPRKSRLAWPRDPHKSPSVRNLSVLSVLIASGTSNGTSFSS
jgi:hypothetical protein